MLAVLQGIGQGVPRGHGGIVSPAHAATLRLSDSCGLTALGGRVLSSNPKKSPMPGIPFTAKSRASPSPRPPKPQAAAPCQQRELRLAALKALCLSSLPKRHSMPGKPLACLQEVRPELRVAAREVVPRASQPDDSRAAGHQVLEPGGVAVPGQVEQVPAMGMKADCRKAGFALFLQGGAGHLKEAVGLGDLKAWHGQVRPSQQVASISCRVALCCAGPGGLHASWRRLTGPWHPCTPDPATCLRPARPSPACPAAHPHTPIPSSQHPLVAAVLVD